jgi:hypothetical protein
MGPAQKDTRLTVLSLWLVALAGSACGSNETAGREVESRGTGGLPGAVSAGAGSPGAGGSIGPAMPFGAGGGAVVLDLPKSGMGGNANVMEEDACGTGETSAELKTITMFIMYDRSWSMNACSDATQAPIGFGGASIDCTDGVTPNRWELTSQALNQFFQSPQADGLQVALRFFPDDKPGCTGFAYQGGFGTPDPSLMPDCDASICAVPAVDSGRLISEPAPMDTHEAALVAAVAAATPPGPAMPTPNPATPTYAALDGAERWATMHQSMFPNEQTIVVLVTDGEPVGCDVDPNNIAKLASDALTNAGVRTYVIGLTGASETQLNQLAVAGGTEKAFFVADGGTATQDLLDALLKIRGMPISCDFGVPASTAAGIEIDPRLVNVNYISGGVETELGLVPDAASCGNAQAWYYDNPAAPTRIFLCPASCATVTKEAKVQVKILAGCEPRVIVPQ